MTTMAKIGFKPVWEEYHSKRAKEFQATHTGKEPALGSDEYVKWLYGVQQ